MGYNVEIGRRSPSCKSGKPIVERMKAGEGIQQMQAELPTRCEAMSQQGGVSYGDATSPQQQQLVHLVGCRDPKVRAESWPRRAAATVLKRGLRIRP